MFGLEQLDTEEIFISEPPFDYGALSQYNHPHMLVEKLNVVVAPAGGAFGSAISIPLLANGHEVTFAFRSEEKAQRFRESRQLEEERLKGIVFPKILESLLILQKL